MPKRLRIAMLLVLILPLAAALPVPARAAGDDDSKGQAEADGGKGKVHKYTNDDLAHADRAPDQEAAPGDAGKGGDPLKQMKDEEERRAWIQQRMADTRKEIDELEQQIDAWEARRLAVSNPLLSRRAAPEGEGGESDQDPLEGLEPAEKLETIDGIVAGLRQKIDAVRDRLRKLEAELRNPAPPAPAPKPETEPGKHLLPQPGS